ncbi:MAG: S8 family peptidase [Cyclobacteriaceae bacterium]|nr:S8 family peptidase [Cyclobacteriaceae bacterium]
MLILLYVCTSNVHAQVNQYMVFFEDKSGTPHSINSPETFLSERALERRERQGIAIVQNDLPVSPVYVQGVRDTGADVIYATKWMNGVLVSCDDALLLSIQALEYVSSVELVSPGSHPASGNRSKFKNELADTKEEATDTQLTMIGLDAMHSDGNRGEGIIIAVFDGGFSGVNTTAPFQHLLTNNQIDLTASFDFISGTANVFQYDDHGTRVLSIMSAQVNGSFTGGVTEASYQLYVTEDIPTEYRIEEYNWLFAAERADSAGADIIHSSLGYSTFDIASMDYTTDQLNGKTTVVTRAAQMAFSKGMVVVASAGNEGNIASWRIVTAPADGEDVIAVGNINGFGVRSSSSSIGPSADGRIKPDVVALGSGVSVVRANGSVFTGSGTSFSAPLVTSLLAGIWKDKPGLKNSDLIIALRLTASQAKSPDNFLGFGIPNYLAIKHYLEQTPQTEPVIVFPNPVITNLTVRPASPEDGNLKLMLISAQGQVVTEREVSFSWLNNEYTADVSALASGFYILRIQTTSQILTFRIVKMN